MEYIPQPSKYAPAIEQVDTVDCWFRSGIEMLYKICVEIGLMDDCQFILDLPIEFSNINKTTNKIATVLMIFQLFEYIHFRADDHKYDSINNLKIYIKDSSFSVCAIYSNVKLHLQNDIAQTGNSSIFFIDEFIRILGKILKRYSPDNQKYSNIYNKIFTTINYTKLNGLIDTHHNIVFKIPSNVVKHNNQPLDKLIDYEIKEREIILNGEKQNRTIQLNDFALIFLHRLDYIGPKYDNEAMNREARRNDKNYTRLHTWHEIPKICNIQQESYIPVAIICSKKDDNSRIGHEWSYIKHNNEWYYYNDVKPGLNAHIYKDQKPDKFPVKVPDMEAYGPNLVGFGNDMSENAELILLKRIPSKGGKDNDNDDLYAYLPLFCNVFIVCIIILIILIIIILSLSNDIIEYFNPFQKKQLKNIQ